jgi:GTP-binding protein LepA
LTKAAGEAAARTIELHNPADMPDPNRIASIEEPWIEATIYVPDDYLGPILKLCQDRRGIQKNLTYVAGRAQLTYELPLNEVVFDFYDRLKSISRGYASFDYHQIGYREGDLVKMSILVNNEPVDAAQHDRPPRHRETRAEACASASRTSSPATSSRSPSRPRSAARSSRGKRSPR